MMTNLFSIFDPSTNFNFNLNWMSTILIILFVPTFYWLLPNNFYIFYNKIIITLFNEFKVIMNKKNNNFNLFFISLFIFIMLNNFIGLFPYIFTGTSHMNLNLTLAFPLWLGLMIYGWMKKSTHMFAHLVPQGTPLILIPFMICIETISNIIRPITLTIRLTANMIAGHLLLTLLSGMGPSLVKTFIPILLLVQILLLTLESAVAIIQSYVFSVLLTLYTSEI